MKLHQLFPWGAPMDGRSQLKWHQGVGNIPIPVGCRQLRESWGWRRSEPGAFIPWFQFIPYLFHSFFSRGCSPSSPRIKEVRRTGGAALDFLFWPITKIHSGSLIAASKTRKYRQGTKHLSWQFSSLCLRIQIIFFIPYCFSKGFGRGLIFFFFFGNFFSSSLPKHVPVKFIEIVLVLSEKSVWLLHLVKLSKLKINWHFQVKCQFAPNK